MSDTQCPICNIYANINNDGQDPFNKIIDCEKCGQYFISDTIIDKIKLPEISETNKDKISSWISEQNKVFNIKIPKLTIENFDSILNQRDKTIKEKFDCFMKRLSNYTNNEGKISIEDLSHIDYCYMQKKDFQVLINKAKKNHYIDDNVSYKVKFL